MKHLLTALFAIGVSCPLFAVPINLDVCNSGYVPGCGAQGATSSLDGYWQVAAGSGSFGPATIGNLAVAGLTGAYLANDANSQWLGIDNVFNGSSNTVYTYRTTFTIPTGFDTVNIAGRWRSDNAGVDIQVNGISIPQALLPSSTSFNPSQPWTSFSIDNLSGVFNVGGTNTLDFLSFNNSIYHGFRVEFSNATADDAVPEPGTLVLLGSALLGLGVWRRGRAS